MTLSGPSEALVVRVQRGQHIVMQTMPSLYSEHWPAAQNSAAAHNGEDVAAVVLHACEAHPQGQPPVNAVNGVQVCPHALCDALHL